MSAYANKTQDSKTPAVADTSAKQPGSAPVSQFKNNRPEAVAQRRLQAAADNSARVKQQKAIQQMAGNGKTIQAKFVIQKVDHDINGQPVFQDYPEFVRDPAAPMHEFDPENPVRKDGLRRDKGKTTLGQIAEYGILAGGLSTAGAGKFTTTISSADSALSWGSTLGGVSGVLGGLGDTITTGKNIAAGMDKANDADTRSVARMDALGSAASLTKSGASAAVNFADLGSSLASGALNLAGGAGMIMGTMDMISGVRGAILAENRKHRIDTAAQRPGQSEDFKLVSRIASASQQREVTKGKAKMGKGAIAATGGLALLIGATPIGWIMLSAAAAVGGAAAIYNYYKKRKHKKDVAIDILGVRDARDHWKRRKMRVEADNKWWRRGKRKAAMADIGPDPLDIALKANGYGDAAHCFNNFVDATSKVLFEEGVLHNNPQSMELIRNMGLKITRNRAKPLKSEPSPAKIAAKLSI